MLANYHTHTWRCNHADGTEEEYIQDAIANGIRILGFSDHTPYFFPDGYRSRIRMLPDQLPDYVETLKKLRIKYQGKLDLFIGVEAEYYPDFFPRTLDYLREQGVEYMILGQHRLGNGINDYYSGQATKDEALLARYCRQTMEAMNTGLFSYFAHPDIFHYVGEERIYRKYMKELCREANSCHMPLEINLAGLEEGIQYPNPLFWEIAAEENSRAVLGIDAHEADAFNRREPEEKALQLVRNTGIRLLDTVELKFIK